MNEYTPSAPMIAHGLLAIFGAIVHALKAHRAGETKTFVDFIALTVMSSFSGAVFALIGLQLFDGQTYLTMAMAGTGGFLGVEGLAVITAYIKDRIKFK